jgi:hypothetical protein
MVCLLVVGVFYYMVTCICSNVSWPSYTLQCSGPHQAAAHWERAAAGYFVIGK